MKVILLGPPGAGKGTLATLVKESIDVPHISTGDILREEMKNESELGKKAKGFIESGELVPDEVVTALVENRFRNDESLKDGFLLDGFPRTAHQAEDLDKILESIDETIDRAVYLEASLEIIVQRLTGRRICKNCGAVFHITNRPPKAEGACDSCSDELYQRPDDNEETIKTRMEVYLKNTLPIVDYYEQSGKLLRISGDNDAETIKSDLLKAFESVG